MSSLAANTRAKPIRSSIKPLRIVLLAAFTCAGASAAQSHAISFNDIGEQARKLAQKAYQKPNSNLSAEFKKLNPTEYQDIRFKPEKNLWRTNGLPFEAAFFPRGGNFQDSVKINEIVGNTVREIKFDPSSFTYGKNSFDNASLHDVGFAGFRVHYAINQPRYKDEVLSFLGASYFRALGKNQAYGISARGLAIDTGQSTGEEFPRFAEFWLKRPEPGAKQLTFFALLDSPRATGAYQFTLTPGEETLLDVKVRLYLRDKIAIVGIAPLTSMYFFGENQRTQGDDYRPEVHDSDGLSIRTQTDQWIWRPLLNPKQPLVTSFAQRDPLGFGLMQRDRNFDHYEEVGAAYQRRPSLWIEPKGKWNAGRVELVQLPATDETNDNIVTYWVADPAPKPGAARDFEYRMHWAVNDAPHTSNAWVVQTRRGHRYMPRADGSIGFLVDFDGPALHKLSADLVPRINISSDSNGQILEKVAYRNGENGGWRVRLRLHRVDNAKPIEMRAVLVGKDNKESETWSYILPPD